MKEFGYIDGQPPIIEGRVKAKETKPGQTGKKQEEKKVEKAKERRPRKKDDEKKSLRGAEQQKKEAAKEKTKSSTPNVTTNKEVPKIEAHGPKQRQMEKEGEKKTADLMAKNEDEGESTGVTRKRKRELAVQMSDTSLYSMNPAEEGLPFNFLNSESEQDTAGEHSASETESLPDGMPQEQMAFEQGQYSQSELVSESEQGESSVLEEQSEESRSEISEAHTESESGAHSFSDI